MCNESIELKHKNKTKTNLPQGEMQLLFIYYCYYQKITFGQIKIKFGSNKMII